MKTKKPLGLYIHIPFCKSKCSYCDFYSFSADSNQISSYIDALTRHIKEYSLQTSSFEVDTIYIGGGTPSTLSKEHIKLIFKTIYKNLTIKKNAEITFEINPESADKRLFKLLKKVGVNRLSFGIQSSNDGFLKDLSRLHTFNEAKDAVFLAKRMGFENISVDLIYGLENQTMDDLLSDLTNFLALDVPHISTYCLKIEEGTALFDKNPTLPSDDLVADMYETICDTLKNAGFEHYEISNFAKRGFKSRHNSKYWDLSDYLGIGASSHSLFANARFSYSADINKYIENFEMSDEIEYSDKKNRFGEYIMVKLRTSDGINLDEFYKLFSKDFDIPQKFIDQGYAKYENGCFFLTEKGFFVSNYIINEILN